MIIITIKNNNNINNSNDNNDNITNNNNSNNKALSKIFHIPVSANAIGLQVCYCKHRLFQKMLKNRWKKLV